MASLDHSFRTLLHTHLERSATSGRRFGVEALGDPGFVASLAKGRSITVSATGARATGCRGRCRARGARRLLVDPCRRVLAVPAGAGRVVHERRGRRSGGAGARRLVDLFEGSAGLEPWSPPEMPAAVADLLPWRAFDEQSELYVNAGSCGFAIELPPFAGIDTETLGALRGTLADAAPEHCTVQVIHWASPRFGAALDAWAAPRGRGPGRHGARPRRAASGRRLASAARRRPALAGKLYGTAKNAVPDGAPGGSEEDADRPARAEPDWRDQSP